MSHYRAGADFERTVVNQLKDEGYDVVRSAGSKSKIDIVAIKPGQLLLIQCKRDGKISPAERTELLRIAQHIPCAVPVLAHKRIGFSAVLLDEITGPGPKDRAPFYTDEVIS